MSNARVIKFRGWHKQDKFMAYNCWQVSTVLVEIPKPNYRETKIEDVELMQFTGLLDKNGKEIYEGDIVKKQKQLFIVKYIVDEFVDDAEGYYGMMCTGFILHPTESFSVYDFENHLGEFEKLEIIGNIYEDPELIKDKDE